jgi:hypothetical protein
VLRRCVEWWAGSPCRACDRLRQAQGLHVAQIDQPAAKLIFQPARGCHYDVGTPADGLDLSLLACAAHDQRGGVGSFRPRKLSYTSWTCLANSRVGTRMRVDTWRCFACTIIFLIIGIRNAKVFRVPVCAVARTSFPSSAGGIAEAWTGVGVAKWRCASFCCSPADRGISANCVKTILFLS